jgi:hypothetical protein
MSTELLAVLILTTTLAVVVALFLVMWRERTSARTSRVALVSGGVLAGWAAITIVLASRGLFVQPDVRSVPPVGIALIVALVGLAVSLTASTSLRSLLTNQANLTRLNMWRLLGVVFVMLMLTGQMPALWALPAGIGDFIVGATAPWIARQLDTLQGRRRAVMFQLFGLADLIVAIGLGIMTSPGPAQVFHTTPTSELVTRFPLVLVPTFLVPLAVALHVVSLWQLLRGTWASPHAAARSRHA